MFNLNSMGPLTKIGKQRDEPQKRTDSSSIETDSLPLRWKSVKGKYSVVVTGGGREVMKFSSFLFLIFSEIIQKSSDKSGENGKCCLQFKNKRI